MGAFFGCCVIAAVLWYVGRRIARVLFAIGVVLELFGSNQFSNWLPAEAFDRALRDFKDEYLK